MLHNYSTNSSNILVRMNNISYFLSGLRFLMSTHIHEYIISIRYRTIVWVSLPQISYQKSRMCVEAMQLPSGGPRHRGLAPGLRLQKGGTGHAAAQQAATTSMSRGLRGRCGAGTNRRPLAGGGASPSPSPARLAAVRGATRRREARAPPEVPCGADHASFLSSIRDRERLSAALSRLSYAAGPWTG